MSTRKTSGKITPKKRKKSSVEKRKRTAKTDNSDKPTASKKKLGARVHKLKPRRIPKGNGNARHRSVRRKIPINKAGRDKKKITKQKSKKLVHKKPIPKKKSKSKYSPSTIAKYKRELAALLPEIGHVQRLLQRARADAEKQEDFLRLREKRHEAAIKGLETKERNRQAAWEAERTKQQRERNRRRGPRPKRKIVTEFRGDHVYISAEKLTPAELLTFLWDFRERGIRAVRLRVQIPATADYPGGYRTRDASVHKTRVQMKRFVGSMFSPGADFVENFYFHKDEINKLDPEAIEMLQKGFIPLSEEEAAERRERAREHRREMARRDHARTRRVLARQQTDYEEQAKLIKLQQRVSERLAMLEKLVARKTELERRIK